MHGSLPSGASAQPQNQPRPPIPSATPLGARVSRAAVVAAAALLVSASAGFGAYYAGSLGAEHSTFLAALSIAMALGLELAKPVSIAAAFDALRCWRLVEGAALALLGIVAIAYSLSAELSLMATMRSDRIAERAAASNVANSARERYERVKLELNGLVPARSVAELQALIDAVLADPRAGGCATLDGPYTRQHCPPVGEWRAEQARSARRTSLEEEMRNAEGASAPGLHTADPGAAALAAYLGLLGLRPATELLTELLILLPVLALELGSALALVLVRTASPQAYLASGEALNGTVEAQPVVQVVHQARSDDETTREKVKTAILNQLAERGGAVASSERGIATMIGVSRPTLRRAISGLVLAGLICS